MSVVFSLVPIAIAAAGVVTAAMASHQLAYHNPSGPSTSQSGDSPPSFALQTRFRDPDLLQAALDSYGCRSVTNGPAVDTAVEGARIVFERNPQGNFDALFVGDLPVEQARTFILDLHDEYTKQVQQQVYTKLVARARARGMELDSEEFQDDNSVVLTFNVKGGP